jgi:hypothetical protein
MKMKVTTRGALAAVLAVAGVAGAGAQSPKIRQMMQREEMALVADIADTNRMCDAKIAVRFDWSDAPEGELERAEPGTARRYCDEALKSLRSVCSIRSDGAVVRTQIRRVICGFRRFSTDSLISLNDGVLDFKIDLGRPSGVEVHMFLVDHLVIDGEPLSVRHAKKRDEERLTNALKRTKQLCGADISARIDWRGMTAEMIKSGDALHCEHALDVIERICQDRPGQDAVRAQIKSVVCGYDAKRSIMLKDGTLQFKSDFTSGDDVRVILVYLQNNL